MFLSQQIVGSDVIIVLGDAIRNYQCLERMLNNFKYKQQLRYKKLQEQQYLKCTSEQELQK